MPLYEQNTGILVDFYRRMIASQGLDMFVMPYMGDELIEDTYFDGNILRVKCNDRNVMEKHKLLFEFIKNNTDADAVIKTNTNVVLDLMFFKNVTDEGEFNEDVFYTAMFMKYPHSQYPLTDYPNGNFYFFSRKCLETLVDLYEEGYQGMRRIYPENLPREQYQWGGIPEDLIVGYILGSYNIPIGLISNVSFIFDYMFYGKHIAINSPLFITRAIIPFEERAKIEPNVTELITKIIESRYQTTNGAQ